MLGQHLFHIPIASTDLMMPFVNEYISPEDAEKYCLRDIDAKVIGRNESRDWTIDRSRDIYLRNVAMGRNEDTKHESLWTFYWKGSLLTLRLDLRGGQGAAGAPGWSHWLLVYINGSEGLPSPLAPHRQNVLDDLQQALTAYKDGGVFAVNTSYNVTLDLAADCVL